MTYLIAFALFISLYTLWACRKEFKNFEERMILMHSKQTTKLHMKIMQEHGQIYKNLESKLSESSKELELKRKKSSEIARERDEDLKEVLNNLANKSGFEVVVEEVPVDTEPIMKSIKAKLPDFMSELFNGAVIPMPTITEKKLVLRKKVANKKLKVK